MPGAVKVWRDVVGLFRVPLAIAYVCVMCGRTKASLSRAQYRRWRAEHQVICRCGQVMCVRAPQAIESGDVR